MEFQKQNKSQKMNRQKQQVAERHSMSERSSQYSQNSKGSDIRLSHEEVESIKMEKRSNKSMQKLQETQKNKITQIYNSVIPDLLKKQQCLICQSQTPLHQFVQFGSCGHKFCQMCTNQYIRFKLLNFQQIFCPLDGCNCKLQKNHPFYSKLSQRQKQKYEKILLHFEILSNPNIRLCKTQKCKGKIQIIKNSAQTIKQKLQCIDCKQEYCSLCFQYYHTDKCDSDMVKFLQKNKRYRQCKSCKRVVQKSQGCTHMTCLCGYYFCYQCGQELVGNHQCKIPTHLNCIQIIRWEIDHKQLFYESNRVSFHGYLTCIQLQSNRLTILRFAYALLYVLSVYPLTIVFSILLILLFFTFIISSAIVAFLILPIIQICGHPQFKVTNKISDCLGCLPLTILVILFYPVFVILLIFQALCELCNSPTANDDIGQIFVQIGLGLRNFMMIPCLLCINPDSDQPAHQNLEASRPNY